MDREVTSITTKNNHEVVTYTYITGREARLIRKPFMRFARIDATNAEDPISIESLEVEAMEESENALFQSLIVSVDGKNENVADLVLDLPSDDYTEVVTHLNAISSGTLSTPKKIKERYYDFFLDSVTPYTEEIMWVELCKYAGCTYTELMDQPQWFIDTLTLRMQAEADVSKKKDTV